MIHNSGLCMSDDFSLSYSPFFQAGQISCGLIDSTVYPPSGQRLYDDGHGMLRSSIVQSINYFVHKGVAVWNSFAISLISR